MDVFVIYMQFFMFDDEERRIFVAQVLLRPS